LRYAAKLYSIQYLVVEVEVDDIQKSDGFGRGCDQVIHDFWLLSDSVKSLKLQEFVVDAFENFDPLEWQETAAVAACGAAHYIIASGVSHPCEAFTAVELI
jgi:hypothetical protein